jgi:hypothetical protein
VAKVEWHAGELYPRVGFIVTNLSRPAERIVRIVKLTCIEQNKPEAGTRSHCRDRIPPLVRRLGSEDPQR